VLWLDRDKIYAELPKFKVTAILTGAKLSDKSEIEMRDGALDAVGVCAYPVKGLQRWYFRAEKV
jgi:hypothetical protein